LSFAAPLPRTGLPFASILIITAAIATAAGQRSIWFASFLWLSAVLGYLLAAKYSLSEIRSLLELLVPRRMIKRAVATS
jgi:hypothetical protein